MCSAASPSLRLLFMSFRTKCSVVTNINLTQALNGGLSPDIVNVEECEWEVITNEHIDCLTITLNTCAVPSLLTHDCIRVVLACAR